MTRPTRGPALISALLFTCAAATTALFVVQGSAWSALLAGVALTAALAIAGAKERSSGGLGATIALSAIGFALWSFSFLMVIYALARLFVMAVRGGG